MTNTVTAAVTNHATVVRNLLAVVTKDHSTLKISLNIIEAGEANRLLHNLNTSVLKIEKEKQAPRL